MTTLDPAANMEITDIADPGQTIWQDNMTCDQIVIALGVIYGDITRIARDQPTTRQHDLTRELGNVILSTARWCRHLDIEPDAAIEEAATAQRHWIAKRRATRPRS